MNQDVETPGEAGAPTRRSHSVWRWQKDIPKPYVNTGKEGANI